MNKDINKNKKRVCIIGSGIAGLSACYILKDLCKKNNIDIHVTIIELSSTLGMDATSRSFAGARLDVPLRVFSEDYYRNLSHLYRLVGVEYGWADYSFNVRSVDHDRSFFCYNNHRNTFLSNLLGLEVISLPIFSNFNMFTFRYWYYFYELIKFSYLGLKHLNDNNCTNKTLKEYLIEYKYSNDFIYKMLLPLLSVMCTCTFDDVLNYPAEIIVDYFTAGQRILGAPQMRAFNGTKDVVNRLSKHCDVIKLNSKALKVNRIHTSSTPTNNNSKQNYVEVEDDMEQINKSVEVIYETYNHDNQTKIISKEIFDDVILATQPYQSVNIRGDDISEDEKIALNGIPTNKNRSILHTDEDLLPKSKSDWSVVNLRLNKDNTDSECMIWMNKIDGHLNKQLTCNAFQTWNPIVLPKDKSKIIVDAILDRPIMTLNCEKAMNLLSKIQGKNNIYYVGAYSLYSMPLLENGCRSSIRVVNSLIEKYNGKIKWQELGRQIHGKAYEKRNPNLIINGCDDKNTYHMKQIKQRKKNAYISIGLRIACIISITSGIYLLNKKKNYI